MIEEYLKYIRRKIVFIFILFFLVITLSFYAINTGSAGLSFSQVIKILMGKGEDKFNIIIWNIRMPRVLGAIVAGIGLSVSGCVTQSILKNPMASPFTLGISQGAAFGATIGILFFSHIPYMVQVLAFLGSILTTLIVLALSKSFKVIPEAMILSGVALGSLFSALTMIFQYFANEVKVASIVFWTFGDIGRVSWKDLGIMVPIVFLSFLYFLAHRWDYNSLENGEDTAKSLGINVERIRLISMFMSSLISSIITSCVGVIGFIGLIAPHIVRRIIGGDYRFLIPATALMGGIILLFSDTLARVIISPIVLPVGAITSFLGAPLFLYLLIRRHRR